MNTYSIWRLLRSPHLMAQIAIMRDLQVCARVNFLYAALDSGLLKALNSHATRQELAHRLNIRRPELLDALLMVGVSFRELSLKRGRFRICGRRSRALLDPANDALVALLQEYVTYHGSAYRHLAERLSGAPLGSYLQGTGELIARSSRVLEPFIADFVRVVVAKGRSLRLLEVGCGSGVYMRYAAEANPQLTGTGLDMQQEVVIQATANLARWGISDRFNVILADIRTPPSDLGAPFDLVTLYNNIYYFPVEERLALFGALRSLLAPGGTLAITSSVQGSTPMTADFDLILRSTEGCAPLPRLDELRRQLRTAGFNNVKVKRLVPTDPLYGITAT